jgi:hypothetical protein
MNREKLLNAITEAERFLARAKTANAGFYWHDFTSGNGGYWHHAHQPDTAAAKRASMDLTRALADLRKAD